MNLLYTKMLVARAQNCTIHILTIDSEGDGSIGWVAHSIICCTLIGSCISNLYWTENKSPAAVLQCNCGRGCIRESHTPRLPCHSGSWVTSDCAHQLSYLSLGSSDTVLNCCHCRRSCVRSKGGKQERGEGEELEGGGGEEGGGGGGKVICETFCKVKCLHS